jgi:hypothetical protein
MNKQGRKMTTENTKPYEGKTCFVITPIGGDSTDIRREADGIIDEVLIPILEDELGFTVEVAHRVDSSGSITQQVIQSVINSDFAICNLATLNPNVMYELALRHAARKPVVTIAPKGTSLPFDISDDRVVFYRNDIAGALQLKTDIQPKICSAMKDDAPDNPVYRAIKSGKIMQEVHAEGGPNAAILDAIEGLTKKVNSIQSSSRGELKYSYSDNDPFKTQTITIIKPDLKKFEDDEVEALKSIFSHLQDSSSLHIPLYFDISGNNIIVHIGKNSKLDGNKKDVFILMRKIVAVLDERGYLAL